jgi:glycosyltransferase involved in cell wall biosynthesis
MKIGYLHIGPPEHGVCRYGRLLTAEASNHPELTVIEADVVLTENRKHNREILINAARQLSEADIIHFQFNRFNKLLWGGGWSQLDYLQIFMRHCSRPLVVTLHDVFYPPYGFASMIKYVHAKLRPPTSSLVKESPATPFTEPLTPKRSTLESAFGFIQSTFKGMFGPDALALREIAKRVDFVFVCTEEEAKRLCDRIHTHKLKVIPHFVESRSIEMTPAEARATLGLGETKVVTLLGFIYPPKGHQLLVEALPELPQDVKVVFAGGPSAGYESLVDDLIALAKVKGVDERLHVTGYLSEEELEKYLIATDLAVCPFSRFSASGSLSTWISVARPILASDSPQVAEYHRLEPDVIKTFKPYTPSALAQSIQELLSPCQTIDEPAIMRLRQKLSMSAILDKHLMFYRSCGTEENE